MSASLVAALATTDDGVPLSAAETELAALNSALADQQRRLLVAVTQMAEFAGAKAAEATAMQSTVAQAATVAAGRGDVTALLARLSAQLADAAAEAGALAATHAQEAAKSTRDAPADSAAPAAALDAAFDAAMAEADAEDEAGSEARPAVEDWVERARYIPVRLNLTERKRLRLLEAALSVSEYTDKVDVAYARESRNQRVLKQLKELCAILCGLVVAMDYQAGQALVGDKEFKENEVFFQQVLEIGRRHKIMNPDKMRSTYGMLVYLLQDSQEPRVQELLEFNLVAQRKTVHSTLAALNCLSLLDDPMVTIACAEVETAGKARPAIAAAIARKESARASLAKRYSWASGASEEELLTCLYSLADNCAFLRSARDPVDRVITFLTSWWSPAMPDDTQLSLAISVGAAGARLSHSHERQYAYCLQSLTLWREIAHDSFKLWCLAEDDLLAPEAPYRLCDTGQGMNRVQQAPRVGRAIRGIIARVQARLGSWVGSSVVHLGDHNVPNALMFIDKYSQVPRILAPIVLVIDEIDTLAKDPGLRAYFDTSFGGPERLKKTILADFFRHGFDGSGADNFFDSGSCIDGRLTSAWNWCSKLEKKAYYPVFKLAGFTTFDGKWEG